MLSQSVCVCVCVCAYECALNRLCSIVSANKFSTSSPPTDQRKSATPSTPIHTPPLPALLHAKQGLEGPLINVDEEDNTPLFIRGIRRCV